MLLSLIHIWIVKIIADLKAGGIAGGKGDQRQPVVFICLQDVGVTQTDDFSPGRDKSFKDILWKFFLDLSKEFNFSRVIGQAENSGDHGGAGFPKD